jgi:alkanesulfonate monooxygenase SsuD/methylene tetrahydromethanopterin reductase-like flavin-dependent oxidoreductase (luciferase family)
MKVGVILPHGVWDEFRGLSPHEGWRCMLKVAVDAEELGFESIWLSDHFTAVEDIPDAAVLEAIVSLSALAAMTRRIRLGTLVLGAAYRNAALTAKMLCTLDAISGGRMELGIGAGWKEDEFRGYGYGFPDTKERLAILSDQLEVITRMLGPGKATWNGRHASVDSTNEPKSAQSPRLPIMVGGNGRNVTWRLAARHADELNLDGLLPDQVEESLPVIKQRCIEEGRDPADLRVSVYAGPKLLAPGPDRVAAIRRYAELGLTRVIVDVDRRAIHSRSHLEDLVRDVRGAGLGSPEAPR